MYIPSVLLHALNIVEKAKGLVKKAEGAITKNPAKKVQTSSCLFVMISLLRVKPILDVGSVLYEYHPRCPTCDVHIGFSDMYYHSGCLALNLLWYSMYDT